MDNLLQDLRFGLRTLIKRPGLTCAAVLALALGIGATSAIFSVVHAVVLRPLPFRDPSRLVLVSETFTRGESQSDNLPASPANFTDWRGQNDVFENVGAFVNNQFTITGQGEPERLRGTFASASVFQTLGVEPAVGRLYNEEEDRPGVGKVVLLSHRLWQRRFSGDPNVVDKQVTLNNESYTVIGVMPATFQSITRIPNGIQLFDSELWVPLFGFDPNFNSNRALHLLSVIARLKPDVSLASAQTEMSAIAARLVTEYPDTNADMGVRLYPVHGQLIGNVRTTLWILLGAVAFVLLIACANVANLLLAQATARQKEVAIRMALGASRSRLIRQMLTESVMLAAAGGAAGIFLAWWGVDLLIMLAPGDIPRVSQVDLDPWVIGFTAAVTVLTGLVFGLAPALAASRPKLNETLKEGGRGLSEGGRRLSLRSGLVMAEVALAVVLLIGAGLMVRSFLHLQQVSPGFNPSELLTMELSLPPTSYTRPEQRAAFFDSVIEKLKDAPGIEAVGATNALPFTYDMRQSGFTIDGRPAPDEGSTLSALTRVVSPDFFRALDIPIMAGRSFEPRDRAGAPDVMIVNQAFARRFFPGEEIVGKRVTSGRVEVLGGAQVSREIVGVVGDVKHYGLDTEARPEMFFPHAQDPWPGMHLAVRSKSDAANITAAARNAVGEVDKNQPINDVKLMQDRLSGSVSRRRFNTTLLIIFAAVALVLAATGIYGVMSYSVTQRTHEIGIRMALGASSRDVLGMVLRQSAAIALAGLGIGIGAAAMLTRLMAGLLYKVSATDAATFVVVSALLTGVALAASYIPARRATKLDPMIALRHD